MKRTAAVAVASATAGSILTVIVGERLLHHWLCRLLSGQPAGLPRWVPSQFDPDVLR